MNKIQFERLLKPLVEIYDEIELELIRKIIFRIDEYDDIKGSLEWYLQKITELGTLDNDLVNILKLKKRNIKETLKIIISSASRKSDYLEVLEGYYNKGLLEVNPFNLYNSTAINRLTENALKDTEDIMNLIDTKVLESSKESYMNILNKAYIETSSGAYTYQESIRNALKGFAKEGIQAVHYANGKSLGIESVVRRDVITRVNKLVGDIDLQNAEELGTDLVYVDQHLGARTRTIYMKHDYEAHAEWQGMVYTLNPNNTNYDNFFEKTGYGEMLGLKGINCYHNFRPFFEWEKIPEPINLEDNKKQYELLQQQRAYERKIRRYKREKEMFKNIDTEEYNKAKNKLNKVNKEYNNFLDDNDLRRDYSREFIATE